MRKRPPMTSRLKSAPKAIGAISRSPQSEMFSKPDSAVWILKCNKVTFRVRLDPNMAAQVKKLN
jgi:hypothetical protein